MILKSMAAITACFGISACASINEVSVSSPEVTRFQWVASAPISKATDGQALAVSSAEMNRTGKDACMAFKERETYTEQTYLNGVKGTWKREPMAMPVIVDNKYCADKPKPYVAMVP